MARYKTPWWHWALLVLFFVVYCIGETLWGPTNHKWPTQSQNISLDPSGKIRSK